MTIQDSLTKELVKYILGIFGLSDHNTLMNFGIMQDVFKTNSVIKIQYEDNPIHTYPIYSSSAIFNGAKLHVVGCYMADIDGASYAALFKLDDFYTYGIKLDLTNPDDKAIFIVSKVKNHWTNLSMYEKIIACAGLEKLNDAGIAWKSEPIADFYNSLVEIIEM